jgi:anti-anti-sigma factor
VTPRAASLSHELIITGDTAVLRMPNADFGRIDRHPADERLLSGLVELEQRHISLDFGKVKFLTNLGLAMLVRCRKRLAERGRRLVILHLQPHIYELFTVTRLNSVLDVRQHEAA